MKKRTHLPDFNKLCKPAQNYIADAISLEIFFFFLCSIAGFLWEILLMYLLKGHYINRGFFYGPWLPIYGVGGVSFHLLFRKKLSAKQGSSACKLKFQKPAPRWIQPVLVFILTTLLGTGIELLLGWFLDTFLHLRYWDYSAYPLQFHGYICLWSALGFGIAGTFWICLCSNYFCRIWFYLSLQKRRSLTALFVLLFAIDCTAALIFPNMGSGITFP